LRWYAAMMGLPNSCLVLLAVFSFLHLSSVVLGSVCSSGIYKNLLFLSNYAPAESYCSVHYPVPAATVTVTASAAKKGRRHPQPATTTSKTTTIAASNNKAQATWSSLLSSAHAIISTACSCIETPSTKTASTKLRCLLFSRLMFLFRPPKLRQSPRRQAQLRLPPSLRPAPLAPPVRSEVFSSVPLAAAPLITDNTSCSPTWEGVMSSRSALRARQRRSSSMKRVNSSI
jgi:hypothetical protein